MRFDIWQSEREQAVEHESGLKIRWNDHVDPQGATRHGLQLWKPKATKPFLNVYFRTWQERETRIRDEILEFRDHKARIALERAERKHEEPAAEGEIKGLKQIAREVREKLKAEFPGCKFSVRTEYYSMGQALHVTLVKADFPVFRTPDELRAEAIHGEEQWRANVRENQIAEIERGYAQLGGNHLDDRDTILTDEAKKILNRVVDIFNADNWDHSDSQTDYYDVHYHVDFNIGSWERPLEIVG